MLSLILRISVALDRSMTRRNIVISPHESKEGQEVPAFGVFSGIEGQTTVSAQEPLHLIVCQDPADSRK